MNNSLKIHKKIVKELNCSNIIFKTKNTNSDIDIIISHKEYLKINFPRNYILINDRRKCDKHIFYLTKYEEKFYIIDFNIDGLYKPGYYNISLGNIRKNIYKENNLFFINENLYRKYRNLKKQKRIKIKYILDFFKQFIYKHQKIKSKKKIVFLGIDGSGKTTLIKQIRDTFRNEILTEYMGWKNFSNPLILLYRNLKYKKFKTKKIEKKTHNISFQKIAGYYIELYSRLINNYIRFSNINITLFDRYFYDWIILIKSNKIQKLLLKLTPSPDLVVYCTAPDKILYNRKKEVPLETIKIRNRKYLKILKKIDNKIIINTHKYSITKCKKMVTQKIENEILKV